MKARLARLLLRLHLILPAAAHTETLTPRDPLNYPLKQWAFVLALALFGGLASWWGKVRAGRVAYYNISALIGELTISAFAGVIAFFGCEYLNLGPFLTPAIVGIAGHMGGRAIALLERAGERRLGRVLSSVAPTSPMPLDPPKE